MVDQQTLQGRWNEITGKLREKWGQLTDQDLQTIQGDTEQLIGLIQRKTGESREAIEHYLDQLASGGAGMGAQAAEAARDYMHQASTRFRGATEHFSDSMRSGYENAETMVSERPLESVGVAFGMGLVAGVLVGIMLRGR